jgi:hypothetical protein
MLPDTFCQDWAEFSDSFEITPLSSGFPDTRLEAGFFPPEVQLQHKGMQSNRSDSSCLYSELPVSAL